MSMPRTILVLLLVVTGCSGGTRHPLHPESSSLAQSLLSTSPARFIADVTLDGSSLIERAFRYGETSPGQVRTFEVVADSIPGSQIQWKAREGSFAGDDTASGARVEWTAPAFEGEAHIELTVATPEGTVHREYRLYVSAAPIVAEYPIPAPLETVELTNPAPISAWDATIPCVRDEILVQLRNGTPLADAPRLFDALDLQVLYAFPHRPAFLLHNAAGGDLLARIETLQHVQFIEFAEPNLLYDPILIPDDPYYPEQYAPPMQHQPEAWEVGQGSPEQILVIMDSGISRTHPDLVPNLVDGEDFIVPPGDGLGGETPGDGIDNDGRRGVDIAVGHGTGCAGITGAVGNNGIGVAGMSWHSKLMPLRIFQTHGDGGATTAGVVAAHDFITAWNLDAANTRKIVACNMSFGGYVPSQIFQEAIDRATATGVTYVGGSGNDNANAFFYPAHYEHVMAASAVGEGDVFAFFSNFGPWITASSAGHLIRTTWFSNADPNTYTINSGTSFASPQVIGLVGLLKGHVPELTPAQVVAQIQRTADNIDALNPDRVGMMGAGRINAFRALTEGIDPSLSADGSAILADGEAGFAEGNRDGIANPGERVYLLPAIRNAGIRDAVDLDLTILSAPDPLVRVLEPSIQIPRISTIEGIDGWSGFPIVINSSTPDNYVALLDCRLSDPTGTLPALDFTLSLTVERDDDLTEVLMSQATGLFPAQIDRFATAQSALRIDLTADREYITFDALTLHLNGTCASEAIAGLKLWRDTGDGEFTLGSEEELAASSYWNDSNVGNYDRQSDPAAGVGPVQSRDPNPNGPLTGGSYTFRDIRIPFPETREATLFVTVDVLEFAAVGSTLELEVRGPEDVVLSTGDTLTGLPWRSGLAQLDEAWGSPHLVGVGSARHYGGRAAFGPLDEGYYFDYGDQFGDYDVFFQSSSDGGATWIPGGRFSTSDEDDASPEVAVAASGRAHVFWYSVRDGSGQIYHCRTDDQGANWSNELRVTSLDAGQSYLPHLAMVGDTIELVCVNDDAQPGTFSVVSARSDSGGDSWSAPQNLSQTATGRVCYTPRIVVAGVDLYCVWFDGQGVLGGSIADPRVRAVYRPDGGAWTSARALTSVGEIAAFPALVPGSSGDAYVAYQSDASGIDAIWIQRLTGNVTASTEGLPSLPVPSRTPAIARHPSGRLDVAFEVSEADGTAIYHCCRASDLAPWSEPYPVSRAPGVASTAPSLTVAPDGHHLYCYWDDTRAVSPQVWGATLYIP